MLAFAKDDLRSARNFAVFFFLVLYEVGTSHGSLLPIPSGDFSEWDVLALRLRRETHPFRPLFAELKWIMEGGRSSVKFAAGRLCPKVQPETDSGVSGPEG